MEGGKKFLWRGVIRHYKEHLPIKKDECIVTLLEGNTPLIPSRKLALDSGKTNFWTEAAQAFNFGDFLKREEMSGFPL